MTAKELLHRIPEVFDAGAMAEELGREDAVVQYDISEPVYHVLQDRTLAAFDGQADGPDVTIRVSDEDLIALMKGDLNPMAAFMTGKLKVKGDVMLAQKLVSRVDRRRLAELL
ncbi:MAG TPA: SCP2 sterol-binding domain-containing protein [Trueperaceae bacterium]|nr:SCP2 sterol-binding domain-containing protein [Trueperaceae bacterium]